MYVASIKELLDERSFGSDSRAVVAWVSALAYHLAIMGAVTAVNLELDTPEDERASVLCKLLTRAREMSEPMTEVFELSA